MTFGGRSGRGAGQISRRNATVYLPFRTALSERSTTQQNDKCDFVQIQRTVLLKSLVPPCVYITLLPTPAIFSFTKDMQ